jgi:predicted alpha-1,6-mannanase (GH76 family)
MFRCVTLVPKKFHFTIKNQIIEYMKIVYVFFILFSCNSLRAEKVNDKAEWENGANILVEGLDCWYNMDTGLWETTSWWNGANILTGLIKYGSDNHDESIKKMLDHTFEKTKEFEVGEQDGKEAWICRNYINDFYDDEGWWALAWMDAWEWTGETRYLNMARSIFEDITNGWSMECGGGLYWKKGLNFKGTISNSLALTLATKLYLANTKDINGRSCLQWAIDIWQWMNEVELFSEYGLLQDGIRNRDGICEVKSNVYTYNQGVVLTGLVNLYHITGEEHYMQRAHKLAQSAIQHMVTEQGVLKEVSCEPERCKSDAEQFKGIFIRHLNVLNHYSPQKEYTAFIEKNVNSIYRDAMNKGEVLPGVPWNMTSEKRSAATTSSALDAFNAILCED